MVSVYDVHTFAAGLDRTSAGQGRIGNVFESVLCLEGLILFRIPPRAQGIAAVQRPVSGVLGVCWVWKLYTPTLH